MSGTASFLDYYLGWARPAEEAYERGLEASSALQGRRVDSAVFCGMGGSGAAGVYAAHLLNHYSETPGQALLAHRLPSHVGSSTLVVALSFSGNTRETLECALAARERGALLAAVARGGLLAEKAGEWGAPLVRVPEAPAPRAGFPGLLYSTLGLLAGLGILDPAVAGVEESIAMLRGSQEEARAEAGRLAGWLASRGEPLILVTGYTLYPVAVRLKNELAENTKLAVMAGYFPESGHNDLEAWRALPEKRMLIAETQDPLEKAMTEAAVEIIKPSTTARIPPRTGKPLEQLLWPTWVGGMASVEAAQKLGRDPLGIPGITEYKKAWTTRLPGKT